MLYSAAARAIAVARLLVGGVLILAALLNFANVVGRYVLLQPIIWADEVMLYATIWAIMIGMAIVAWQGTHLKMEIVFELAPPWAKRVISAFINGVTTLVCLFVTYQALQVIESLQRNNQHSVVARIPLAYVYLAIPVGFVLTLLVLLVRFWDLLRGGEGRRLEAVREAPASGEG